VVPYDQTCCVIEWSHLRDGGFLLYKAASLGGVDGPAVGSMGDWNQARDGPICTHTDAGGQCADAIEAGID